MLSHLAPTNQKAHPALDGSFLFLKFFAYKEYQR